MGLAVVGVKKAHPIDEKKGPMSKKTDRSHKKSHK